MSVLLRLLFILAGALLLGVVANAVLLPIGHWYEMNRAQSESDLSQAFVIALAVQAVCVLVGGWLGNLLFGRWRRRRAASRH
ncbi:hypothetical protein [Variovorax sp.]|uniref:hypothetical protein n=1 Tax=Variovorax sp. TaxID=1871043 RepID=UPI00137D3719|nr:hypothetical protein [Variovorax sp.]KAF1061049.1 MAG: hypothetical protein GAK39_05964 [Variovorax sp.]